MDHLESGLDHLYTNAVSGDGLNPVRTGGVVHESEEMSVRAIFMILRETRGFNTGCRMSGNYSRLLSRDLVIQEYCEREYHPFVVAAYLRGILERLFVFEGIFVS